MFMGATKTRVVVTAAIAAMWLTACGGGGGGDDVAAAPSPAPAPAPGVGSGGNPPAPAPVAALGTSFTATGPSDVWHSLSSSTDGQVVVAGQADLRTGPTDTSPLFVSRDGGVTFTDTGAPSGIWIASDVSGDGNRIAAVQFNGGGVFISVDRGQTFVPAALPAGVAANSSFEGVTLSEDGTRIAAVIMGGRVIVGTVDAAGAVTWGTTAGLPATASWRSVDSSANGQVMVAVGQDPVAFISTDGGANWTALAGAPLTQNWYRVKLSADGQTIAMAANSFGGGSADGIYVSKDQGATFTRVGVAGDYSAIAMSADGGVIAATVSNDNAAAGTGSVQLSRDGGTSFATLPVTVGGVAATETDWRAVTMSGDASRMAVAAGRFLGGGTGQIYLTTGSRP